MTEHQPSSGETVTPHGDALPMGSRPRLVRRARVRFDPSRDAHVLLMPESVLVLTRTAAEVLALCDGHRTVGDLITELAERYPGAPVGDDARALLERLRLRGLIELASAPRP